MLETFVSSEGPIDDQQLQRPETIPESQVFDEGRPRGEKVTGRMPHSYPFWPVLIVEPMNCMV